jgi:hypothetical protein
MPYALFDHDKQIGGAWPTEAEVWRDALRSGLIADLPVVDEAGGQVLPRGYHVGRTDPEDLRGSRPRK